MSILQATELRKSYGLQDVLVDVSVHVPQQARIALVGPNGIGKSTLLRLLAGLDEPDEGQVHRAKRSSFGFLPQEAKDWRGQGGLERTLWEAALDAFAELRAVEEELQSLEEKMADPRQAARAMARYGPLQEEFERAGGYSYQAEAERVLRGLGFSEDQFSRPLEQLSGGERTRGLLAKLLLQDPDLLILDEPTNHLDVAAIEWLEDWLNQWPGAAVIVSHDRYFLDRTVDTIWELSPRGVELYRGDYSAYARQRRERRARQAEVHAQQQEFIAKERDYIQRNIAGQNTRQAQGRRKRLERFMQEEAVQAPAETDEVSIRFQAERRTGDVVLRSEGLQIGRDGETFFAVPDLVVRPGERIAISGPNGVGKTTLLKTVIGEVSAATGEVELGANVQIGYFEQGHEGLNPEHTVLESLLAADNSLKISSARSILARFLFQADEIEKPVASLSGGERGRLALARLAQAGANLLLLDEPTTHLDLASQEVLQEALDDFPGTVLFITHDRYLMDALASQVWTVSASGDEMDVFHGGYEARRRQQQEQARQQAQEQGEQRNRQAAQREPDASSKGPSTARRMQRLEDQIEQLEQSLEELAAAIEAAGGDVEKVRSLGEEYGRLERDLQAHLSQWERLAQADESA